MRVKLLYLLAACSLWSQSSLELNALAEQALREEDYIRAASFLRQSLAVNPNYLDANENLALALFFLGEDQEAERYARTAVRLAGNRGRSRLLLARVILRRGGDSIDEAEQLLNQSLTEEGPSIELYNTLAAMEVSRNRLPLALRYYELSLDRQPNQLTALLASFLIEDSMGNARRASSILDQLLRIHGAEPAVLEIAVNFYHRSGQLDQATALSDRLINLVVNWTYPRTFIRAVQDRVRLDLTRQKLDPGLSLRRSEDLLREAIRRDSASALSFALLGALLFRQNKIDEAQTAFRSALDRQKDDETLRLSWERSVRQLALDNPARLEPARFHATQAESLLSRNLIDQARESYRRLLRLDPFDRGGRWGLARTWRELGFPTQYLAGLLDLKAIATQSRASTRRLAQEADRELDRELDYWQNRWYPDRTLGGVWRLDWDVYRYWRDAQTWNLNQPGRGGRPTQIAVFLIDRFHHLEGFPDQAATYLDAFGDLMLTQFSPWPRRGTEGRVGVLPLLLYPQMEPTGGLDLDKSRVRNLEEAIESSRRLGVDFFLVLDFRSTDLLFQVEAELRLGSTGRLIQTFSASRRGAERVLPALRDVIQRIQQFLPIRATLAARRALPGKSLGLVPLGALHGLKTGDELLVIKPEFLMVQPEFPFLKWTESSQVATIKLTQVDDWMSEGEINHIRGQDLTSVADSVVFLRPSPETPPVIPAAPSDISSRILNIR